MSLVRPRDVARDVAPIELFFDLVYVFTVSQLAKHLLDEVDGRGMVETLILALAVMYAWFMTVWTSNWLDVERRPVQLMLLALMFGALVMATGVGSAFGDRPGLFVSGYLAVQVGRTLFAIGAFRGHRLRVHFVNALAWELAAAPLWIGGAFAEGDGRLALWGAAIALTYAGVIAGHPLPGRRSPFSADSQIHAEHLLERFRLFFLIALGETVLTVGNAFAHEALDAERLVVLAAAFAGTVALWWCYFQRAEGVGVSAATSVADASRILAVGNYALIAMVTGIVAIAVGDELAIAHPHDAPDAAAAALIFGGPAVFLLAQLVFLRNVTGAVSRSRLLACLALALLAAVSASLDLLAAVIAAGAVLVAVAVADTAAGVDVVEAGAERSG